MGKSLASAASSMTTLEAAVATRMKQFDEAQRDACIASKMSVDDERVEYLLKSMPFIREYVTDLCPSPQIPSVVPTGIENYVDVVSPGVKRSEILMNYMASVEHDETAMQAISTVSCPAKDNVDICRTCGNRLVFHTDESILSCEECGLSQTHFEGSSRNLSYDEELQHSTRGQFCYKKFNHLVENLKAVQGKENTTIPEDVIDAVKAECKKYRLVTKKDITPAKIRMFLKKLGLAKYYEHVNHITSQINGLTPPQIPQDLEDRLKQMFLAIQKPFEKHRPPGRSNMLKYSYFLYKSCELLGEDAYLPLFPLLKSKFKIHQHDIIWKKITGELGWEYIPTV